MSDPSRTPSSRMDITQDSSNTRRWPYQNPEALAASIRRFPMRPILPVLTFPPPINQSGDNRQGDDSSRSTVESPTPFITGLSRILINPSIHGSTRRIIVTLSQLLDEIFKGIPPFQRLEYLTRLAWQMRNEWVCEVCLTMHCVLEEDTPVRQNFIDDRIMSCPLGRSRWSNLAYNNAVRLDYRHLQVDHRHIQLALKHTRTRNPYYRNYVRELLTQIRDQEYVASHDNNDPSRPEAYYSARPKIVKGDGGAFRFLLRSIFRFRQRPPLSLSSYTVRDLRICPHLIHSIIPDGEHPVPKDKQPEKTIGIIIAEFWERKAGLEARNKSIEIYDMCHLCRTDYTVRVDVEGPSLQVTVWQDFGQESSPCNPVWRAHCPNVINQTPEPEKEPPRDVGAIQKL
ncbi:hypothetical protein HD806DRAFT_549230 [Xylariaceae sp. AK1471]|nr:hypothetical protein HD806DRAFT_549230 [Xylariaceae sp. AK1471]